jgi:retron-type reverse transcriptase
VEIPKKDGGVRILGVPTVADRIAQQVVASRTGGDLFEVFHPDSHGYQLNKSAVDAVANTRKRCWELTYAFDEWMKREHSKNPFSRYADDAVAHCQSEVEAKTGYWQLLISG